MSSKYLTFSGILRASLLAFVASFIAACDGGPMRAPTAAVDPTQPVIVAIMVPYGSGEALNDQLAQNLVNSARMASRDLQGAAIDLRVYNTGGNAELASSEAARAIAEGAQIIIGPLFSTATSAVAAVAATEGVNVLSFSNNPAVAGGNVYIMGLTFENIANRLFGYSASTGVTNIGVVYPEGIEGEAGLAAARRAASRTGTTLAAEASYPLNMEGLSEAAPVVADTMQGNGVQAILFTDTPTRGLPFIAAALGSEGVSRRNTQFMGLARWGTSVDILQQPSLQNGWFVSPDPEMTAQFNERYLNAYGSDPHTLAALAYDAVAVVGALIRSANSEGVTNTFSATRLTNPAGFIGVNGVFRFKSDGTNERALAVMQVDRGEADIIDPAPRNFGGFGY